MKAIIKLIAVVAFVFLMSCPLWATNSDSHNVTVAISAINEVNVSGPITMTISTATAGQQPDPVQDATSTLDYTTNSATNKKITAGYTVADDAGITLEATVTSTSGNSEGIQTLGTVAVDVITFLSQCVDAGETITYDATATVDALVGNHVFTVTYTMVDQ
jgi:hypothetical protein